MRAWSCKAGSSLFRGLLGATLFFGSAWHPLVAAGQAARFVSGVNLVEVYAAVADPEGRPVSGLRREDFTVLEDGRPQTVTAFAEANVPLSVAVGIDRSFSMGPAWLPSAKSGARVFLGELRSDDQAMLIAIGSQVETIAPLSTDRAAQFHAIDALQPWGTTGLYDAVIKAIDAIQAGHGRRALVLLSDGQDRYSEATQADAMQDARRSDVMIYPVTLGGRRAPVLTDLASLTGGRSFEPRSAADVNAAIRTIAGELHHQYLLGYVPSRPITQGAGEWRTIEVHVHRSGVTVRTRNGYVAQ